MDINGAMNGLASLGTSWVLWLLVILSFVGLAVIVERALYLSSSRDDVSGLQAELRKLLLLGEIVRARHLLQESPCFEARIAAAGLSADERDGAEQRMAAEKELSRLSMEQRLSFLGTLGNNAPFLGLLGTVIGVIRSFHELHLGGGQVSSGLMAEVGESLVATAVGLLVALPAVAAFNFFQRIVRERVARGDALGREVIAFFATRSTATGARPDTA